MPDYANGKIYRIVCGNMTYIGSTLQPLSVRMAQHRRIEHKCRSRLLFEQGKPEIYLIENFPCKNREELNAREYFHIQKNECVNRKSGNNKPVFPSADSKPVLTGMSSDGTTYFYIQL
jgi:hypothetical protein